jgi:von Willebrand factor type A domain
MTSGVNGENAMTNVIKRLAIMSVAILALALLSGSAAFAQSCNTADRSVLLILDASGSMNARLPNGETRMAVAQRAIKGVAGFIPAQAQLSLRIYGARSAAGRKNCEDTDLAVPFGPASAASGPINAAVDATKAQGYTPIAYSLGQAANDFPAAAKERVIVLVSDGKETCQGDPVLAARALKNITVHTIGFVVDTAARGQLQAIARATGGTYFDAPVGPELPDTLKKALNACSQRVVTLPPKPLPGKLRTTSVTWTGSHAVLNAETGEKVGAFNSQLRELTLPAGIYEVRFGPAS